MKVQHVEGDQSALFCSTSLASDRVRLFGAGKGAQTPILAPKKDTEWDVQIEFVGWALNIHTGRLFFPKKKVEAVTQFLEAWPANCHTGTVKGALIPSRENSEI